MVVSPQPAYHDLLDAYSKFWDDVDDIPHTRLGFYHQGLCLIPSNVGVMVTTQRLWPRRKPVSRRLDWRKWHQYKQCPC
eukprot:1962996-Pyramimonas_sp.AAC.1